ncbi:MAG: PEP/pyruvate-binding domain-containing protein [Verrucomicrobiaceae bacterium]
MIIEALHCQPTDPVGGKALALAQLTQAGFKVPTWFAVTTGSYSLPELTGPHAVRSSAMAEDGSEHSFAGQFESFLNVAPQDIPAKIEEVRNSQKADRVSAYTQSRQTESDAPVAVIVQEMVDARFAGVAFGADPVSGDRDVCLVSAVEGLGESLVSGEVDSHDWRISRDNTIAGESTLLTPRQIKEIATLCRQCNAHFNRPQDIEWAIDQQGTLWLLQSRAITTLSNLPDPSDELVVWDNSNIAESYGGVTTPLTFSFASRIYEHVYREFCKLLGVPTWKIEANDTVFPKMLGLVRGRTYYNLVSWYRVLALLPGFSTNRGFMEQMMGVKKPLPDEIVEKIVAENTTTKWRDRLALSKTTVGLLRSFIGLPKQIRAFNKRLDSALALSTPLPEMRSEELVAHYQDLESQLLRRWDAPLVNDFFAMIFYGLLGKISDNPNELLQDTGDIISARPPRLIKEMAGIVRHHPDLAKLLTDHDASLAVKRNAIKDLTKLNNKFNDYLAEFGDRCLEELKLESPTVVDDPGPLLTSIGGFAQRPAFTPEPIEEPPPLKGFLKNWILRKTRDLVRNRENLRFERTRVFGRVRQIMRELGGRLTADGRLEQADDIFYLKLDEVLDHSTTNALKGIVTARKEEFEEYHHSPAPPDRFSARGPIHRSHDFTDDIEPTDHEGDLQGIGACSGIVRGPVRVVTNPREATLLPGEILVATQTDPGWVVLFPAAAGLLVERGSLLSHSAIVARELQLPCIVSLSHITTTLKTGDLVEMNGKTGQVTLLDHEE